MDYDSFFNGYMEQLHSDTNTPTPSSTEDIYTEEYWGKIPEFVKISQLFDAMLEKAKKEPTKMNPNTWKENAEICKLFSKVFGLKDTWFYWVPLDINNAFTVTLYSFLMLGDSRDLIENRSGKGFYDKSHRSVFTVYGYCGLLLPRSNMTGKELTAIFLHEFGHNFDYSPYHHVNFFARLAIQAKGSTIEQNNNYKETVYKYFNNKFNKVYEKQRTRDQLRKEYQESMRKYLNAGLFKNILVSGLWIGTAAFNLITAIPTQYGMRESKMGEQFADSFATAYGYGPELISGLLKLSKHDDIPMRKVTKATLILRDFNNAANEIYNSFSECHGTEQERTIECIKKLRHDLATSDYPAGMKSDIEDEIRRLEDLYAELLTATPDDKLKITKFWRRICDKFFGGAFNLTKHWKPNKV